MERNFFVCFMADKPFGTLYVGVTNDLARRAWEHRNGLYKGFTRKYELKQLVYYEVYPTAVEAICREKAIKKWRRDWKKQAIEKFNPTWRDLYDDLQR